MKRSPTSNDRIIGENITRLRRSNKLSLQSLADQLGLSRMQVEKYESGANRVALSRAIDICAILACPLTELCVGTIPTLTTNQPPTRNLQV